MRLNPNFTDLISKFIALGTPFDGTGGHALEGLMTGYTLHKPLRRCAAKGI